MRTLTICAFFLFVLTDFAGAQQKDESITIDGINYSVRFESAVTTTDEVANVIIPNTGGGSVRTRA